MRTRRYRVHFARNLLATVSKGSQDMVAAALRSVFVQQTPKAVEQAKEDVLAFRTSPPEHSRKIWSTNPLERLSVAPVSSASSPTTPRSSDW